MIDWFQPCDDGLFRFVNITLSNRLFDAFMPWVTDMPGFVPLVAIVVIALIWKGGARGRIFAVVLLLGFCAGDWVISDAMKHGVARLRPFNHIQDAHVLIGKSDSFSMPSSHALNWFMGTAVAFIYYRRSLYFMLPLALTVSFSRIYNGVHYPSDVLAGAVIGAGCGAVMAWTADALWRWAGVRWFPIWHAQLPSLLSPAARPAATDDNSPSILDRQWIHLGWVIIGFLLLVRLAYLAAGVVELSEDEAYQWIWSKHLALSYYSKPLLIALVQFAGTHLWGDSQFGVRFFSPVISAVLSVVMLRFMAREAGGRTAFFVMVILNVTPLMALGSMLMTIDPLSVLFWTAAMVEGWQAVQPGGRTNQWLRMGLWMGLGSLAKYTNLVQWICWISFFAIWPPARAHLRRRGPWLALLVASLFLLPVLIWNAQHDWITIQHVASDGRLGQKSSRTFTADFLLTEGLILHPVFYVAALWAAVAFWRRKNQLQLYLFCMGAPLFLLYLALSFHSRIELNWIAPSVVPLFCLMAIYWQARWNGLRRVFNPLLGIGIGVGFVFAVLALDANLLTKLLRHRPPPSLNPLRRVLGWKELAQIAGAERRVLEKQDGKPCMIIAENYGFTSEITFYLPEAKSCVTSEPLVYCYASRAPRNQFYFWPSYLGHAGQDAIFVREVERPQLKPGWLSEWWHGGADLYLPDHFVSTPVPPELAEQFETITDLGVRDVIYSGNGIFRRAQFFACHNLRKQLDSPK
jgi:4-amino-4-deoxy-L-arabinose transferase-like glycosyltransferase/membrane-associated phospholipid phosphatase